MTINASQIAKSFLFKTKISKYNFEYYQKKFTAQDLSTFANIYTKMTIKKQ